VQETVLHSFLGGGDGYQPLAGLTNVNGVLYGTTGFGGYYQTPDCERDGCGTIFKITTAGAKKDIHNFKGGSDGNSTFPSLVNVNGVLYGTTSEGGTNNNGGAFFKITPSGVKTLLYSFGGANDGGHDGIGPSDIFDVNGVLYGTTYQGGANGDGTVFSITTSGVERVLYSFAGGSDSANPESLTSLNGVVYGTASGGTILCGGQGGQACGTIFAVTTSGTESVLYDFTGGSDGGDPEGITAVNGVLYGTTSTTVFQLTTSGAESTLHTFAGGNDGSGPTAALTNVNGVLYGTTTAGGGGGGSHCSAYGGCGTVFSITTSGAESVLYNFPAYTDGAFPQSGLANVNGVLYGTTRHGGAMGIGTVFSLTL
jgi:uncharacterized repeat protein (TIGR03803 family)